MRSILCGAFALAIASTVHAEIIITEIWAGGIDGAEATSDWFELTNYGESPISTAGWFYDDESGDPTVNDPIMGLGDIGPGESVVLLVAWDDDWSSAEEAIGAFDTAWDVDNALENVQIGWVVDGAGLGGGGDAVFVFDGNMELSNIIATQSYDTDTTVASFVAMPDGTWNGDYAVNGVWGAYESAVPASDEPGIGFAVGSPGRVPEPASLALLAMAACFVRRR